AHPDRDLWGYSRRWIEHHLPRSPRRLTSDACLGNEHTMQSDRKTDLESNLAIRGLFAGNAFRRGACDRADDGFDRATTSRRSLPLLRAVEARGQLFRCLASSRVR